MSNTFTLEVATPERLMLREHAVEAQVPCASGYIGVLPGHAPLLAELGIGDLKYTKADGTKKDLVVLGGYVEVNENYVHVLAARAEEIADIDVARAEAALNRANERLLRPVGDVDMARALNSMKRAQARLEAAKHQAG